MVHTPSSKPEILIFGGTFDPPHRGHLECLEIAKSYFPAAEIFVLPAFLPPLAATQTKTPTASFDQRIAMCALAFASCIGKDHILDLESTLSTPNYTVQTLRALRKRFPNQSLAWIMGLDQLERFDRWSEPTEILRLASLVLLPRDGGNFQMLAQNLASRLGFKVEDCSAQHAKYENLSPLFFLPTLTSPIASRDIRRSLEENAASKSPYLSDSVHKYISEHRLYVS